jgi:hypothetical protein
MVPFFVFNVFWGHTRGRESNTIKYKMIDSRPLNVVLQSCGARGMAFAAIEIGGFKLNALEILHRYEAGSTQLSDSDRDSLDTQLTNHIRSISNCKDLGSARPLFNELGDVHQALATLAFKHGIKLSDKQREFVRQFDRWDDEQTLAVVFQRIKSKQFPWCEC